MADALLLGIDVGTSSAKGVLTTADGDLVATRVREHGGLSLPRPGWAEHDADAVWWAEVCAISRELTAEADGIAAVCVSGIGPCLLPTDGAGRPLRPAILYGIDTRASAEVAELTETLGAARILDRGGSALSSQAVGPKLLWLRRAEPEVWSATRRFFMASSYAMHRLTGEYVLDHHSASQCDPLYDLAARSWAEDWAQEIAPGLELPRLAWSNEVVGAVHEVGEAQTGIAAGTPVCAGTIDAWAEAHSVGVCAPRDFMLMYGTTMFMVQVGDAVVADPLIWTTAGVREGTITHAGGLSTSGALTSWLRELTGGVAYGELLAEAAALAPGAEGLLVLPYFAGERTPLHDPDARGVIAGLTLAHGRGHLYRALLEGSAYAVRHALEAFDAALGGGRRIVAVGGGTTGRTWTQIVSDVTGVAQEVPAVTVGASYGDALLAAQAVGLVPATVSWATTQEVVEPDAEAAATYEGRYALYGELRRSTLAIQHQLAGQAEA
ncbi:MAG: FGGY-family carbohydrate kinase [Solirubrobacterales bacterium]